MAELLDCLAATRVARERGDHGVDGGGGLLRWSDMVARGRSVEACEMAVER